jgi:hypothetical protein
MLSVVGKHLRRHREDALPSEIVDMPVGDQQFVAAILIEVLPDDSEAHPGECGRDGVRLGRSIVKADLAAVRIERVPNGLERFLDGVKR